MTSIDDVPGTRDRLIAAMSDLLQRRGLHGIGLSDVLAQAHAPKGVLYHHFPGGKVELAVAAIQAAVAYMKARLDRLQAAHDDPVQALRAWLDHAQKQLEQSDFERGSPLATVALESTAADHVLRQALAQAFGDIRELLTGLLSQAGVMPVRAAQLATLMVGAYEGALIQSRVAGSAQPVRDIADVLLEWVRCEMKPKTDQHEPESTHP